MLAPKTTPAGSAPNSSPDGAPGAVEQLVARRRRRRTRRRSWRCCRSPTSRRGVDRACRPSACRPDRRSGPSRRRRRGTADAARRSPVTTIRSLRSLIAGSMADTLVCGRTRRQAADQDARRPAARAHPRGRRRAPQPGRHPHPGHGADGQAAGVGRGRGARRRTCGPPRSATRCCSRPRTATRSRCRAPTTSCCASATSTPSPPSASRRRRGCTCEPSSTLDLEPGQVQRRRAGAGDRPGRRHRRRADDGVDERREPAAHARRGADGLLEPQPPGAVAQGRHQRRPPDGARGVLRLRRRHVAVQGHPARRAAPATPAPARASSPSTVDRRG